MDEFDARTLNVGYLRDIISLVSQEPVLFDCSIADNVSYGLENITRQQVVDAAKLANIHKFINDLPEVTVTLNYQGFALSHAGLRNKSR